MLEALQQDAVRAGDQVHGGIPAPAGQLVHGLRHQADGDRRQRADADARAAWELALADAGDGLLQGDHTGRRVVLEHLAQGGEGQALGPAREQADVEQLLELAQGLGDGGLGHGQPVGGAADMVSAAFRSTILQQAAADDLRGRLQGVFTVVVAGGPRVADTLHGTAAALVGTTAAAAGGGALVVVGVIIAAVAVPAFVRYRVA